MLKNTVAGVKKDVVETVSSARSFVARVFAATPKAVVRPFTVARQIPKLPATVAGLAETVEVLRDDAADLHSEIADMQKDIENIPTENDIEEEVGREVERQLADAMEDRDFTRNVEDVVKDTLQDETVLRDALENVLDSAIEQSDTIDEMQEKAEATDEKVAKLLGQLNILLSAAGLKTLDENGDVVDPKPEAVVAAADEGVTKQALTELLDKFAEVRDRGSMLS